MSLIIYTLLGVFTLGYCLESLNQTEPNYHYEVIPPDSPVLPKNPGSTSNVSDTNDNLIPLIHLIPANLSTTAKSSSPFPFDHFPRYNQIVDYMTNLVRNRTYSKLIEIGRTIEKRPIYAIEVIKNISKPVFLVDAGIHAREWATHIAAISIVREVVENESWYANKMSLLIIFCLNPDGYEYSHTKDRLWRKNRSPPPPKSNCYGVDLNRNFDSHWGRVPSFLLIGIESSTNPCDSTYRGRYPFSEKESRALKQQIMKHKPYAYLTLHSYGSYILYPWGFANQKSNKTILHNIARKMVDSLKQKFNNYIVGSSAELGYNISGASDDWAAEKQNVSIAYTLELSDYSNEPFIVPESNIQDVADEGLLAFTTMFYYVCKAIIK